MAKNLKVGDHIKALRSSNKSISLVGSVLRLNEDGRTIDMDLDANKNFVETVHVDDVTVLGITPAVTPTSEKSTVTVNGKAI